MVKLLLTFEPSIRKDLETWLKSEKERCERDVPKKLNGNRVTRMLQNQWRKRMGFEFPSQFDYVFQNLNECLLIFHLPELPIPKLNYVGNLLAIGVQNRFKKEFVRVKVYAG